MPTELLWYPTWHTASGAPRTGAIPSHEFSGVVETIGPGATGFNPGDAVYGMNDWSSDGAMAEYTSAPATSVANKPRRLTDAEAAAVPIGGLTAWQALFDHAHLKSGERVLIHGGAGSVGSFGVQLARVRGARVTTTVSSLEVEFARSLGADEVVDYRNSRLEDLGPRFDVIFDTVGGETLDRSWALLAAGGRMVRVVSTAANSNHPRVKKAFFIVRPDRGQLEDIGALLDSGQLRAVVDAVVPLSRAAEAYAGRLREQRRGKLVVAMTGE